MPARLRRTVTALTLTLVITLVAACTGPESVGLSSAASSVVVAATPLPVATSALEKTPTGTVAGEVPTPTPTAQPAATTTPATSISPLAVGALAPDFALADLDGKRRSLSDYRGKVVMLNFWASWCGHCRSEIPALVAVYGDYKDQGLEIVAVSVGEDPTELKTFVQENGMTFTVLADSLTATMAPYQLRSVPTSYFLDAQGVIREVYNGAIPEDVLRETVKGMLGQ
jgi:peroxiredoxin